MGTSIKKSETRKRARSGYLFLCLSQKSPWTGSFSLSTGTASCRKLILCHFLSRCQYLLSFFIHLGLEIVTLLLLLTPTYWNILQSLKRFFFICIHIICICTNVPWITILRLLSFFCTDSDMSTIYNLSKCVTILTVQWKEHWDRNQRLSFNLQI